MSVQWGRKYDSEFKKHEVLLTAEPGRSVKVIAEQLAKLNKVFHLCVYKAAPFLRLFKMISDLWDAFERCPSIFTHVTERAASVLREDEQIIEALQQYMVQSSTGSPEVLEAIWQKQDRN